MKFGDRQPGTSTTFIDSASGEHVLQIASDEDGTLLVAYHLYDDCGALVAECALEEPPLGLTVHSDSGDLLLNIPPDIGGIIQYRLYGSTGSLLTFSDGVRTMIYPHLRMEGVGRSWARHS